MELLVLIIIQILILLFTTGERQPKHQTQTPIIYLEPTQPTKKQKSQHVHDVLGHILLFGLPGIGKSTLCEIIANKLSTKYGHKVSFHTKIAGQLKTASDVEALIGKIKYGDIILIDEIASLKISIEEIFYSVLQDYIYYPISDTLKIDNLSIRLDRSSKDNIIKLPKCTFLAATTNAGSLSRPLRERFPIEVELKRLEDSQLSQIATDFNRVKQTKSTEDYQGQEQALRLIDMHINSLDRRAKSITQEAADEIARRSLGTPRLVNNFRLHASCRAGELGKKVIDTDDVEYALDLLGVDKFGLHPMDRRLINYLLARDNKPSGISALAAIIGASPGDVKEIVVPRMSAAGMLTRDNRSWIILSQKGIQSYKNLKTLKGEL